LLEQAAAAAVQVRVAEVVVVVVLEVIALLQHTAYILVFLLQLQLVRVEQVVIQEALQQTGQIQVLITLLPFFLLQVEALAVLGRVA
jgi:hypothetical protein